MSYRSHLGQSSSDSEKSIQWHITFCNSMENLSGTDESIDEHHTQPRVFYNGQESSSQNVSDTTYGRSYPSLSRGRGRGRRAVRRTVSGTQQGRFRTSGRKHKKNPKPNMKPNALLNESDSELMSCEDNSLLPEDPLNALSTPVTPEVKYHPNTSNCRYEFFPNTVNIRPQGSMDNIEGNSPPASGNAASGAVCDTEVSDDNLNQWKKIKDQYFSLLHTVKPSEIIMDYRKQIETLSNECTLQNLNKIDKISSMMSKEKAFASIFALHSKNLVLQQKVFDTYVAKMKPELNYIQLSNAEDIVLKADGIKLRIENECSLFQRTLPAYAYKNDILNKLKDNQVIIISSDSSYLFNVVTPLIVQSELTDYSVVSCESSNMAYELLKQEINSIIKNNLNRSPQINYMTESKLLNSLKEGNLPPKVVSIINLPLKRSIVCDLLLAFIRDFLSKEKSAKLALLVSIFDDTQKYKDYFSEFQAVELKVPRLLMPVKTVWRKEPLTNLKNYKDDIVCTALSIHILNEPGNVLVFLPSEAEAKTAMAMFNSKIHELCYSNVMCILLHENFSDISHFKTRGNSNVRTIFFGTDNAEVKPILSVRYVVDCGLKRDYIFNSDKSIDVLMTVFGSRTKARLRKSLIGAYGSGICYRIYSKENFCSDMSSSERPDILSLNPFNTLITIFHHAPENALSIQFVEPLNDVLKYNTVKLLKSFNALKNGHLTQLGKNMVKLPFCARYSKLVLQGINWGFAYEAVIFVAYFSVETSFFKHSKDEEYQRIIDAAKLEMIQHESDPLTFLYIFKSWVENNFSNSWCENHHIDWGVLNEVKVKVAEFCQQISECLNENIHQEFADFEDSVLIEMLFNCFGDQLCVFSGHYRSGYRIVSSRHTAFIHPSSMLCSQENLPQLIIFNKMVQSSRNFLLGITSVSTEMVLRALTDKTLEFDYSDVFDRTLVPKVIEPVSEKIIKQVLLGKKGKKLQEVENYIKETLNIESLVIEPCAEKGSISVFAVASVLESAVRMVEDMLKENLDNVINAERTHIIELKKAEVKVPLEVKCIKGAIITSVKVISSSSETVSKNNYSMSVREPIKTTGSSVQYSINLTWVRRRCNGVCYVDFTPSSFMQARRLATKKFLLLDSDVYIEVSNRADNQLLFSDVPPETRNTDVEKALKSYLPGIEIQKIELKFVPPFETSDRDIEQIKIEIQENCEECTNLVDFEVIVPSPKNSATLMTAYINVFDTEDLTSAAENLSNTMLNGFKVNAIPVYRSVIKSSLAVYNALEPRIKNEMHNLQSELSAVFLNKDLFRFQVEMVDQDLVRLKLLSNDIRIMKQLQRTVNELLEGEVLNKNAVNDIHKLFCHGGHMWLRTLEKSKNVYIHEDYNSKIIRVYGTQQNCFQVKESILNFLQDTENEAVESINLCSDNGSRLLLKTIIKEYGVSLKTFVELYELQSAVLDIKSCRLLLHGNRDSIEKAKEALNGLSNALDTTEEYSVLTCGETCPVCDCPAFNLTFRLQHCGHLYCNECIKSLVEQAKLPLQCCAEDCSEDIVLDDIIRILEEDDENIKKLLDSSLTDFLERNRPDIFYCPTPDCSMFFYKNEVSGKVSCPLCQNEICSSCNVIYHHGFSCDVYQGSRKDPDYSFKVWRQGVTECKECPRCKTAIEKNSGCDHMTCLTCKAHFCWICVREFPSAVEVYNHIPFCDKYPKW